MLKVLKPDFHFEDERGTIDQLIHDGYRQINVITSKKGVVRGGHYHKQNDEAFYVVSGGLDVTVNDAHYHFAAGDFFGIEANDIKANANTDAKTRGHLSADCECLWRRCAFKI